MKIAFTSVLYGGLDTYVLEAGRWLAQYGHTVHVFYIERDALPQRERYTQLHFHVIRPTNLPYYVDRLDLFRTQIAGVVNLYNHSRLMAKALREVQLTEGLDLVEMHEGFGFPRLFKGIPYVVKMHGAEWTFRQYCEDGRYHPALPGIERRLLQGAKHIYAISYSHAAFIAGACNIPPRQIYVTHYPSDLSQFQPAEPPRQGPPFRLIMVGRLQRRKGTHTAVAAMRKIWEAEPDTHLYLYGGEHDFGKGQIEALIPVSEHQGRIHIEGFIPHETLIQRYQEAHVYLAPTRYETFGYTILEAMSCGRPVIGTDIGPIPELIRHEETGWLFPRDDVESLAQTIVNALRNHKARETYGQAGRQLAKRFDIEPVMARQLQFYKRAVDDFKKPKLHSVDHDFEKGIDERSKGDKV